MSRLLQLTPGGPPHFLGSQVQVPEDLGLSVGSVTQNAVRCQGSSNAWPRFPFPKLLCTGPWPRLGSKSILGVWTSSPEPHANVHTCRALCRGRGACSLAALILWCYGAFLKTCWVYGPGLGVGEWRSGGWVGSVPSGNIWSV